MSSKKSIVGALRNRAFRTLWLASTVSNTGGMIQQVGSAWLMTILTTSPSMVALVQGAITLSQMIAAVGAGVLADNYDRRTIMLTAQIFMLVASVGLAVLAFFGGLTPWLLLGFTFLIGSGMSLHNPSWQASFSQIVPREDLPSAVAMNAMGMNVTRSIGPALGGVIVAMFGASAAFGVNAVSYVVLIASLLWWRPPLLNRQLPRERFGGALATGLRYLFLSPELLNTNFRAFVFGFSAVAMQALLPLVARDSLAGEVGVYGILLGAFGFGAVVGALSAAHIRARLSNESIIRYGACIFAATSVIVGLSHNLYLTVGAIWLSGMCWLNVMSLLNVTIQLASPSWVIGRMISLFMTCIFGGMAFGSWTWGVIAETDGLAEAYIGAGVVLLFCAGWGVYRPMVQHGIQNLNPLDKSPQHDIKLDLNRRSGPIAILVKFTIRQEDIPAFLSAMAERRRIRIRNGAQRWALMRDLENPEIWTESYHLSTWTEYIRHLERRTVADDAVTQRIIALHSGPVPVEVQRMIERPTVQLSYDTPRIDLSLNDLH